MLSYEVIIQLDDVSLAEALEAYMRGGHVVEVLATGCFLDAHFEHSQRAALYEPALGPDPTFRS